MERNTKRIIAIALIAVIAVGGGYGIWYLLQPTAGTYAWSAADCPGAPITITMDQIIKVGIIGDTDRITGKGALQGARLAAKEINEAGGIRIGLNKTYYIGITSEDTDEADPVYETSKATAAADRMVNYKQVDCVIGGFRTEMLVVYAPLIMQHDIPFLCTGSAYDLLTFDISTGQGLTLAAGLWDMTGNEIAYGGYKNWRYFFRNMPLKLSRMTYEIASYLLELYAADINGAEPVTHFNIIREDLTWNLAARETFISMLGGAGLTLGVELNYSISADTTTIRSNMDQFWDWVKGNQSTTNSFTIPLISAIGSQEMLASYVAKKPDSLICGIDVPSQEESYFTSSLGNCRFQINFVSLTAGVNKTDITIPFWNAYVEDYDESPTYTAVGSHDALLTFAAAVKGAQTFAGPAVKEYLETLEDTATGIKGAGGIVAYDTTTLPGPIPVKTHDLIEGFPIGYGLFCQWNATGGRALRPSSIYSAGNFVVVNNTMEIPYWWT